MSWTVSEWKFMFSIAQFFLTTIIGIYVWIMSKHKANRDAIATMKAQTDERLDDLANRMTKVETEVKHMPNAESIGKVHARLDKQTETLHELVGVLTGVQNQVAVMNKHLLDREK